MSMPVASAGVVSLAIAGETMVLSPLRAMWWERQRTLIVADLHLGKEETFRSFGVPMPDTILDETLRRLDVLIEAHAAERIVVVGDLVHARRGLSHEIIERVRGWRDAFKGAVELVIGNHDRSAPVPPEWRVTIRDDRDPDGPFRYCHEPPTSASLRGAVGAAYVLSGHLHPTVRLAGRIDRIVLPCFAIGPRHAVLPAFTSFSRGVAMSGDNARLFAIASGEVIEVQERS